MSQDTAQTDDHLDVIAGKHDQLIGRVQELYGLARDAAEREGDHFQRGHEKGFRFE